MAPIEAKWAEIGNAYCMPARRLMRCSASAQYGAAANLRLE